MAEPLRVSIFPYLPDLAGDKGASLTSYISRQFFEKTGIQVEISSNASIYDLKQLKTNYLTPPSNAKSFDVMEVDTILLGELANSKLILKLQDIYDRATLEQLFQPFFPSCIKSATFKGDRFAVPTLQCANFLMEIASEKDPPKVQLLKDWQSFSELKASLDADENAGIHVLMAADFRGSWGLPMFYLQGYIDEHGQGSVSEGVDSAPALEPQLIKDLKSFTDYGEIDGSNPDTDGEFHKYPDLRVKEVIDSKHILMYAYSESLGEILNKAAAEKSPKTVLKIACAPLESDNFLLTYTDGLVVNKFSERIEDAKKFIQFYTSLDIRTAIAFGRDLPPSVKFPRYVMPARIDFFTDTEAREDKCYQQFYEILTKHSIPAPNHDIYEKRTQLQKSLKKLLGMEQAAHCQVSKQK